MVLMKRQLLGEALLLFACLISCTDRGVDVEYLEVVSIEPQQNATNVDKAQRIRFNFDQHVHRDELRKIEMRYVDDGSPVEGGARGCFCPITNSFWEIGPVTWKPGKTVEVTIPDSFSDIAGRRLRNAISFQFTTVPDEGIFELSSTSPQTNDTVSLGGAYGIARIELTFTDYAPFRIDQISLSPEASIIIVEAADAQLPPSKILFFGLDDLVSSETYELTISQSWTDYEGQSLPREYRVTFHTAP